MFSKKSQQEPDLEFFTVYDSKSKTYREPFPAPNKEVLLRDFNNAFRKAAREVGTEKETNNVYYTNAEDYSVFSIGTFDFSTGQITSKNLEHVINLHDIRSMITPSSLEAVKTGH